MNTKQLIETYYQCFNEKQFEKLLNLLDDSVVHDINQGERQVGRNSFRTFLALMDRHFDETLTDIIIFADEATGRAAAEFTCSGKYIETMPSLKTADGPLKATGQTYRLPVGAFFTSKNGKITRVTNYYNLHNWIEQVKPKS